MEKEIQSIGSFKLYDRVRIKNTEIKGNIVLIHNEKDCEIEYDTSDRLHTHNVNELEKLM